MSRFILTLSCPDRLGIVHAVAGFLTDRGCNIVDSQQFGDRHTGRFFMRVHFVADAAAESAMPGGLPAAFAPIGTSYAMDWQIFDEAVPDRTLIMVSRQGHCLNDLLYRWRIGALPTDIAAIVSNHTDFADLAASYGIPFHHVPVTDATKAAAETRLLEIVEAEQIDLVVLARYMQVLSDSLCRELAGRIINIHHSFLPSFKGARPYTRPTRAA